MSETHKPVLELLGDMNNAGEYPRFFPTIVGVAPNELKKFSPEDVAMLVAVFNVFVGTDALRTNLPLRQVVSNATLDKLAG